MDYSMLEYMTRGIEWNTRKKLIDMMISDKDGMFNFLILDFLKDPYTTNRFKLMPISNYHKPENVEAVRQQYRQHFAKINQMCIENGIYPFFDDPNDLADCEGMREYLIHQWPEWILNKHFKVNSYYEYIPPVYNPDIPNPHDPFDDGE